MSFLYNFFTIIMWLIYIQYILYIIYNKCDIHINILIFEILIYWQSIVIKTIYFSSSLLLISKKI